MFLKDRATVFVSRPSKADPYDVVFDRYDLRDVMIFEKKASGADGRDEGKCVIYFFPKRSHILGCSARGTECEFPEFRPGDRCVIGVCRGNFNPKNDEDGICCRIVSVEKRFCGSENAHHIVIEAV